MKSNSNHIIKVCLRHGPLTITQVTTSGRSKSGYKFRCKECLKISHALHYQKHKDRVRKKQLELQHSNPEKYREIKKRSNQKHAHKYRKKANIRNKIYKKENIEHIRSLDRERSIFYVQNLPDTYIRDILTRRSNLSARDIPLSMVEIKRASILIKRLKRDFLRSEALNKQREETNSDEQSKQN